MSPTKIKGKYRSNSHQKIYSNFYCFKMKGKNEHTMVLHSHDKYLRYGSLPSNLVLSRRGFDRFSNISLHESVAASINRGRSN
jgi:hypothetical protein